MARSTASVPTENGSRYLQQLSKHWAKYGTTVFDKQSSSIDFAEKGKVSMQASATALDIEVSGEAVAVTELAGHVEDHIKRYGFREQLDFAWSRGE